MKKFKNFLLLTAISIFSLTVYGQDEIAMVDISSTPSKAEVAVKTIDKEGISQISEFLRDRVSFPFESISYANEIRVRVQVSLDTEGKIIDRRIVESTNTTVGNRILKSLDQVDSVSPILVDGKPVSSTFQIPLIFK